MRLKINRRHAQTSADSIFSLADLARENLNALRASRFYKGEVVGDYTADLLVEDKVIVELKTVENLDKVHEAQILNYLEATGLHIGLLVNFKRKKADIKRMVLDLPEGHEG